eukprot:TRINITY_DN7471_c1_g1_i1.p1 TRINITY_DN7471_c1_g1~~TRINITY_DN7471_c1_g1_i1.p1  ORF type:complete len:691 (+),score=184.26 TRINITY_DN7471_c1_g1_i1:73-2145(+)
MGDPSPLNSSVAYHSSDLDAVFAAFDRDGNGVVSMDEFAQVLQFLRPDLSPAQIADVFASVEDRDGGMSRDAVCSAAMQVPEMRLAGDVLRIGGGVGKGEFQSRLAVVKLRRELGQQLRQAPPRTAARLQQVATALIPEVVDELLRDKATRQTAVSCALARQPKERCIAIPPNRGESDTDSPAARRALARACAKVTELRAVFESLDRDGSGAVSRSEFLSVMRFLCPGREAERVGEAFGRIDRGGGGQVYFADIASVLAPDVGHCLRVATVASAAAIRKMCPSPASASPPPADVSEDEIRHRLAQKLSPEAVLYAELRHMVETQHPAVLDAVVARVDAYLPPQQPQARRRASAAAGARSVTPVSQPTPGAVRRRSAVSAEHLPPAAVPKDRGAARSPVRNMDERRRRSPEQRRSSVASSRGSSPDAPPPPALRRDRSPERAAASPGRGYAGGLSPRAGGLSPRAGGAASPFGFGGLSPRPWGGEGSRLVLFWQGQCEADCVCGCSRIGIEAMLAKRGKYLWLEGKHHYVQWLFPKAVNGVSGAAAPPLNSADAAVLAADQDAYKRLIRAYDMMLDFWGFDLVDGQPRKAANWEERFQNIERHDHNYLRISRVLISLNMRGCRELVPPFVTVLLDAVAEGELPGAKSSLLKYWIPCCKGAEGNRLRERARKRGLVAEQSPYFRDSCRAALK